MVHEHQHASNRRALSVALAITATFAVVELVGGLVAGSLALVADAAHMATDVLALGLSLFAAWAGTNASTSPGETPNLSHSEPLDCR